MALKKINKAQARRLYNRGEGQFIMVARLMRPEYGEYIDCKRHKAEHTFDQLVNSYEYFNCNHETGTYCAFYA